MKGETKMPFTKDDLRINRKGRPAGSKNIGTDEVRGWVLNFLEKNIDTLQTDFDDMFAKDRVSFIERMLKMILPPPTTELERLDNDSLTRLINKLQNNLNN